MIRINIWKNYKTSVFDINREFMTHYKDVYSYLNQDLYFANNRVFILDLRGRLVVFGSFLQHSYSSRTTNPFFRHPFYR